ncbi:MAG: hypothetical protein R2745_05750 [Vicinamibacterales bacterium]
MPRFARALSCLTLCALLGLRPIASAQTVEPPVIHRVSMQPDTGVLTITGVGLGPDLLVTVDGQPVPQLPGASNTQLEVLAPVSLVTMPGTYRLTVVDPMRRVGDAFVVTGPTARLVVSGDAPLGSGPTGAVSATGNRAPGSQATGFANGTALPVGLSPSPLTVIEDSGSPYRTAVGFEALLSNAANGGLYNTAVGYRALRTNTAGNANTATGYQALQLNTTGLNNTSTGYRALATNTTGDENTASGYLALLANTTGNRNTAIGNQALQSNTTANFNTAIGSQALRLNSTGASNTAGGDSALANNSTGSFNTAHGGSVLASNTTGLHNTASGYIALRFNTTGSYNTAGGSLALGAATTASFNTAYGGLALGSTTTGASNTASGYGALYLNTTGTLNTAVGQNALVNNATGSSNVAVGQGAGFNATTGSYNVYLGADVAGTAADTNTLRIGLPYDGGTGMGQNQTFIAGIRGTAVTGGEVVFVDAAGKLGSGVFSPGPNSIGSLEVIDDSLTAADIARDAIGSSELAANSVTAAKVAFNYAASTSEGGPALDVACVGCVDATEVGFSFASLGANTFTGTQTLAAGDLELGTSTATAGRILRNGNVFLHSFGLFNTFVGTNAGNLTMTGTDNTISGSRAFEANTTGSGNTASGESALAANTTGNANTASGASSLKRNTTGGFNTADGVSSLVFNTVGSSNTASGYSALVFNTTGSDNTAVGADALAFNDTGASNVAVGRRAGYNAQGSHTVFLGANVLGTTADANTIRIGLPYDGNTGEGQTQTFIAGIFGTPLSGPATQVFVDANGQLGTLTPPVTTGGGTVQPFAMSAIERQVQEQQAAIEAMAAVIADLRARLARIESGGGRPH